MDYMEGGFVERPEWRMYRSVVRAHAKAGVQDINVKFYIPGRPS
jgi:hypothetical protein